jgi:DMSO/TMAO reductase YedYZ molybdopterin-dependent catalytic subunit
MKEPGLKTEEISDQKYRRKILKSLLGFGLSVAAGGSLLKWLQSRPENLGIPWPLRDVLEINNQVNNTLSPDLRNAKEFPMKMAVAEPRINGTIGLESPLDLVNWKLEITDENKPAEKFFLSMEEIMKLPEKEITFEFKCIEGWSEISNWSGTSLYELARHYKLAATERKSDFQNGYVSLQTPDKEYYVGLDLLTAFHPQTLLCYKMNGELLTEDHGAPLRLITPHKYGIKSIKRVGSVRFTKERPGDYWAERGYDYDASL